MTSALFESNLQSLKFLHRGKVRDIYEVDAQRLLIVQSDRLSAFDVILPTPVPGKGEVLTALSLFWFKRLAALCPNHLLDVDPASVVAPDERDQIAGRAMVVRKLKPLPVEAIVRGYLAGSGWKEYRRTGAICGIALPQGLQEADRLPEAIFTPSTKAPAGTHDENITFAEAAAAIGSELAARVREVSLNLYRRASAWAEPRGIILADTKFEFGEDREGRIILIDEVLTPDSSRFWPREHYAVGRGQPSLDKQPIRDYLDALRDWDKKPPPPDLPPEVVQATTERYREIFRRLTGTELAEYTPPRFG